MELGVIMTRQNFGFPVFAGSPSCSRCCVRARWEVDTSAGRLSEAKTQRRPTARERECERGGFLCCFVVFVSFFRAGQGKKKARRGDEVV